MTPGIVGTLSLALTIGCGGAGSSPDTGGEPSSSWLFARGRVEWSASGAEWVEYSIPSEIGDNVSVMAWDFVSPDAGRAILWDWDGGEYFLVAYDPEGRGWEVLYEFDEAQVSPNGSSSPLLFGLNLESSGISLRMIDEDTAFLDTSYQHTGEPLWIFSGAAAPEPVTPELPELSGSEYAASELLGPDPGGDGWIWLAALTAEDDSGDHVRGYARVHVSDSGELLEERSLASGTALATKSTDEGLVIFALDDAEDPELSTPVATCAETVCQELVDTTSFTWAYGVSSADRMFTPPQRPRWYVQGFPVGQTHVEADAQALVAVPLAGSTDVTLQADWSEEEPLPSWAEPSEYSTWVLPDPESGDAVRILVVDVDQTQGHLEWTVDLETGEASQASPVMSEILEAVHGEEDNKYAGGLEDEWGGYFSYEDALVFYPSE